ncbi:MAG: IclR family transcriptional regulator [Solirubrobacterales bacterium]|nr:IclR family transcriptional regulator [Solirubrobacterales bacterium]
MPRPRRAEGPETPKVLGRALRVLEAFDEHSPQWSEAGLRRELGLPSSTLNRILRVLESNGYVLRREDGQYRLGLAAIRLGNRATESLDLAAMLDSLIREVAREAKELTLLAVPDFSAGKATYIAVGESTSRLRVTAEVGTSVPLTAGATARVLLAFQPQTVIDTVLERPLQRIANGTLTEPDVVRARLEKARQQGWTMSWEETYDGAWAVATPVLGDDGKTAFASIGVASPITRHTKKLEADIRRLALDAAFRARGALGYTNVDAAFG